MCMSAQDEAVHYVVARSRGGYAVCAEADLVSEFGDPAEARLAAHTLARIERESGRQAVVVDLLQVPAAGPVMLRRR